MYKTILSLLIGGFLTFAPAFAQPPNTLWTQTFGGSSDDNGFCVKQTDNGGYIITGGTASYGAGNVDVYLIKTDALGVQQWFRTFGGNDVDRGKCVQNTWEGGYIIAGETASYSGYYDDVYLIKTNSLGNMVWSQTFGGSHVDDGESVQQTPDGGYIIAGSTRSFGAGYYDVYLIKTDMFGNEEWSQTFGGSGGDRGNCVQNTSDGGYIIAGYTGNDVYLIKTDSAGIEQWSQIFDTGEGDVGEGVQQTFDGGYIITGYGQSGEFSYAFLIKTDSSGVEQWTQTYSEDPYTTGRSVQQTSDGGYIVTGSSGFGIGGGFDVYVIKTDASGVEQWSQTFGGVWGESGRCVQQVSDGGYIIVGGTDSYGAGGCDMWVIRLDAEVTPVEPYQIKRHDIPLAYSLASAYPNPFNPATTLSFALPEASRVGLSVYDISGRLVTTLVDGWRDAGVHEITFDGSNLASGLYLYRIQAGSFTGVKKMLLVK